LNQIAKRRNREKWRNEARQDEEYESQIEQCLRTWKRREIIAVVGLVANIAAVVPFLYGHSLHDKWDAVGKNLVLLAMVLLLVSGYTAGITYSFWDWLRKTKKLNKKFARPGSKYRTDEQNDH